MSDFYELMHEGRSLVLPRVTAILDIIDKSRPLMGWATKLEREALRAALEDALTQPGELDAQTVWSRVDKALSSKRAWVRQRDSAAEIGKKTHAIICWHTRKMLGEDPGPEPGGPDPALRAVVAWLDWTKAVDFQPQMMERTVYCPWCAYAGTFDVLAKVEGQLLVVDYKTGKAIYEEAHLQALAYRHGLAREGIRTEGGLLLRLPKTEADPGFEAVPAKPIPYRAWLGACTLWRWRQWMAGKETGTETMTPCEVET